MFAGLHQLSHHAAWRRQLEMLLESAGEGIYGIDLGGRCIFINGTGAAMPPVPEVLEIGKGRLVREGSKVAILSLGTRLAEAYKAADALEAKGLSTSIADLRFAKPLDEALIRRLIATHEVVVTIEEGAIGGLGAHVLTLASDEGLTDAGLKIRTLRLPDVFQDHDSPDKQYAEAGLMADDIVETVLKALRHNSAGLDEAGALG